jgi:hypothetical protein
MANAVLSKAVRGWSPRARQIRCSELTLTPTDSAIAALDADQTPANFPSSRERAPLNPVRSVVAE